MLPLGEYHRGQAARYASPKRRLEYLAVRMLVYALTGEELPISYRVSGRPFFAGCPLQLSISHTSGYAAVLFSEEYETGIDIEAFSDRIVRLKERLIGPDEKADTTYEMLLHWSAKEAVFKRLDEDGIDFGIQPNDEDSETGGIGFRDRNYDNADDNYDDDDDDEDDEDDDNCSFYYTKADYLNAICALMGGYVAEELVLSKLYDNTYYLLTTVDCILSGMSRDGLMGLDLRYSSDRNDDIKYTQEKLNKVNAEFDKIIDYCYKKAKPIIEANAELIRKLMPVLVDKGNIFKPECEKILNELGGIKTLL